jgi:predicted house-cleaning noncanonical NTP pyrophosphatase (MazG superfamily)
VSTHSFNKLVRDEIPRIIEASGRVAITRTLPDDEFEVELKKKLIEETQEFTESGTLEELADILEVVLTLASRLGADPQALEQTRATKSSQRGGFQNKVFIIEARAPESS